MRNITILLLSVLLLSCVEKERTNDNSNNKQRIKENASRVVSGTRVTIIEIDNVEYIVSSRGGIVPITK